MLRISWVHEKLWNSTTKGWWLRDMAKEDIEKKEVKATTPPPTKEEMILSLKSKIRNSLITLSNLEPENREEIYFLLTIYESIFSGKNPNFYQVYKELLSSKSEW